MIIFGARSVTTTPERGIFYCPSCKAKEPYSLKNVRRFFTLYFIPLIPLDKLGSYVECDTCNDTYKPNVLSYDPKKEALKIEAEYHLAVKKIVIHMLLADGVIDDVEVIVAQDICKKITNIQAQPKEFIKEINHIATSKENLSNCLHKLQGHLNNRGKEIVIKAALLVAMANGEFHTKEKI